MKLMKIFFLLASLGSLMYVMTCRSIQKKEKEKAANLYSPALYDSLKKSVAKIKQLPKEKDALVNFIYKKMFPFWYDTEWDFNGTTQVPRQGKIACGYFVTTILRDAGVQLERVKLACAASEQMIKTLTTEDHIRRYSNYKIDKFCTDVKKHGKGLFVVGLDSHTGFLLNTGDSLFFIHANGYSWADHKVIKEVALKSPVLESSAYKVVGYLTDDADFLKKWKEGK
jgi:hypothetical protein